VRDLPPRPLCADATGWNVFSLWRRKPHEPRCWRNNLHCVRRRLLFHKWRGRVLQLPSRNIFAFWANRLYGMRIRFVIRRRPWRPCRENLYSNRYLSIFLKITNHNILLQVSMRANKARPLAQAAVQATHPTKAVRRARSVTLDSLTPATSKITVRCAKRVVRASTVQALDRCEARFC
jgi:hypothetical protein